MARPCFSFGSFLLDAGRGKLLQHQRPVPIGQRAAAVLEVLLLHAGDVVTKDALLNAAWPKIAVEESNLSVQIAALRRILGPGPDGEAWISTVQRVGYRFDERVTRRDEPRSSPAPIERLHREPSILVLPFGNLGGDPAQDYFADGLTQDITTSLSRLKWLVVAARRSPVIQGRSSDARIVGQELGVRYVLDGSVRRDGQRLRIGAGLTDASTGLQLWADRFDGKLDDFFALQDRIAADVVSAVEPYLFASDGFRAQPRLADNMEAWGFVMRAMPFVWTWAAQDNEAAIAYLRQALQIDPAYARANALMAWIHAQRLNLGWDRMQECRADALAYARLAIAKDPTDAWGYLALGYTHAMSRDTASAVESLTASIAINPSFGFAHAMLGMAHCYAGASDAGLRHVALALRLSPRDPQQAPYLSVQGLCHLLDGRFAEAAALQLKVVDMRPHFVSAWRTLAAANGLLGDEAAATAALAQAMRLQPSLSLAWIERYHPIVRDQDRMIYARGLQAAGLE